MEDFDPNYQSMTGKENLNDENCRPNGFQAWAEDTKQSLNNTGGTSTKQESGRIMAYLEHTAAFAKKHLEVKENPKVTKIEKSHEDNTLSNSDMNS